MEFDRKNLDNDLLLSLYEDLLFPRMIEEKMLVLLRQGKISKWFSGIGQEAISVGVTRALRSEDYLLPLHRNLGVFTSRKVPLERLIAQWLGKPMGFTQGRDRSFHFGLPGDRIIGMISHLGAMLPVADGLALAAKLDREDFIVAAFIGDGGTSEGDFHEALNVAAVWDLPVIFVIENNGYGLSTPIAEQYKAPRLATRADGYGIEGYTIDGNNVLEVYHTTRDLAEKVRTHKRPVLLECMTFRMRGHEEASGTRYVPEALFEHWKEKDPIQQYHRYLLRQGIISEFNLPGILEQAKQRILVAVDQAFEAPAVVADPERETESVYAPQPALISLPEPDAPSKNLRLIDAIREGLLQAMERHQELLIMGQDIAEYGGVFKITEDFVERFGKERVRNTPLCESAILGAGLGLSLRGRKSVVEMQFADFVSCGFNQIVNNLAKNHYRWGHAPDVVVRMPTGGGTGAGPYHSQSTEAWFTHVPGLKIVFPSNPFDAKGLLTTAIADPNPVMFFEHKGLYRKVQGEVPDAYYNLPFGEARILTEGEALTLVTYGQGVLWAQESLAHLEEGQVELIDLRTLLPWDQETVLQSVKKTGKCLVLTEATLTGSFASEIAAYVSQHAFEWLDGPVVRLGSLDTPVPFHSDLEQAFLPAQRLSAALQELLSY